MLDIDQIETRYAKSGALNIAYQMFGAGDVNVVLIPGWASNFENIWILMEFAIFAGRLAQFARVLLFDRRGTVLSDPVVNPPTLEERIDDVRAVMDAVGWQRAAIWGISEGGPLAMMFAATYPDRVPALVLFGTFARYSRAADYPHGRPADANARALAVLEDTWGNGEMSRGFAPSLTADATVMRALARLERMAMSPGTARKLLALAAEIDVRHIFPAIRVPTLILHRIDDQPVRIGHARYLAQHIAGAKYVELPGQDHFAWTGDTDALLDEVREFLTGMRASPESDRVLTTILFCAIVDSTQRAATVGVKEWKRLLAGFHALAGDQLQRFRGAYSTPPAMDYSPRSTVRPERFVAAQRSPNRCDRWGSRRVSASTPANVKYSATNTAASRSTLAPELRRRQHRNRCWCRRRSRISSSARGSCSRTWVRKHSKAYRTHGVCLRLRRSKCTDCAVGAGRPGGFHKCGSGPLRDRPDSPASCTRPSRS